MKTVRSLSVPAALGLAGALVLSPAAAAPSVVASIKPVHSLVASVMEGVGEPELLVDGGASPHTYAMRPSDATALSQAGVVFWVGETLETFLGHPLESLAGDARIVALIEAPGLTTYPYREGGVFEGHEAEHAAEGEGHAAGHEDGHENGHRADHGEEHAAENEAGAAAEPDGDGHGHEAGGIDPHVWLDPGNAIAMLDTIAATLGEVDPENAARYAANAEAASERIAVLDAQLAATLKPVEQVPFIVFHDGYQYFQRHYGLRIAGSITLSPDRSPGAARLREIRAAIAETGAACVFAEPQFEPQLVEVATEGTAARHAALDPLGAALENGPGLYPALLREMAEDVAACLGGGA